MCFERFVGNASAQMVQLVDVNDVHEAACEMTLLDPKLWLCGELKFSNWRNDHGIRVIAPRKRPPLLLPPEPEDARDGLTPATSRRSS